jgi:hypothetical protein
LALDDSPRGVEFESVGGEEVVEVGEGGEGGEGVGQDGEVVNLLKRVSSMVNCRGIEYQSTVNNHNSLSHQSWSKVIGQQSTAINHQCCREEGR